MRPLTTFGIFATLGTTGIGIYTSLYLATIAAENCASELEAFTSRISSGQVTIPALDLNVTTDMPAITFPVDIPDFNLTIDTALPSMEIPVTLPEFDINVTSEIPVMTIPVEMMGVKFNITIPAGNNMTLPIHLPSEEFNVTTPNDEKISLPLTLPIPPFNVSSPSGQSVSMPIHIPPVQVNMTDIIGHKTARDAQNVPLIGHKLCYQVTLLSGLMMTAGAASFCLLLTFFSHRNHALRANVTALSTRVENGFTFMRQIRSRSPIFTTHVDPTNRRRAESGHAHRSHTRAANVHLSHSDSELPEVPSMVV